MTPTARSALAVIAVLCAFAALVAAVTLLRSCACAGRQPQPVAHAP